MKTFETYLDGKGKDIIKKIKNFKFFKQEEGDENYKKAILMLKPEQTAKITIMQAIGDEYKSVVVEVNVGSAK